VRALVRKFKGMMSIETDDDGHTAADVPLGDLEALQGVVKFPVRIKCATLAWNTLTQALDAPVDA
jgi:nitrogen fixation NifU-like protein